MGFTLAFFGKPSPWTQAALDDYAGRLRHLAPLSLCPLKESKRLQPAERLKEEAALFVRRFPKPDHLWVLLSEEGRQMTSRQFAEWLQSRVPRSLVFLIGSPYGLDPQLRAQADLLWSLSALTLTHEHALIILAEQLYRAVQISRGHPYHHE